MSTYSKLATLVLSKIPKDYLVSQSDLNFLNFCDNHYTGNPSQAIRNALEDKDCPKNCDPFELLLDANLYDEDPKSPTEIQEIAIDYIRNDVFNGIVGMDNYSVFEEKYINETNFEDDVSYLESAFTCDYGELITTVAFQVKYDHKEKTFEYDFSGDNCWNDFNDSFGKDFLRSCLISAMLDKRN